MSDKNDIEKGHCGGPPFSLEFKLVDIPEMNYTKNDIDGFLCTPRGEICLRGPACFK